MAKNTANPDRAPIMRAASLYRDAVTVASIHPDPLSQAISQRLRFLALNLMVEARGGR